MTKKMYVEVIEPKSTALTKKQDKWIIIYVERDESGDNRQEPTYFSNLTDNTKLCLQVSVTDIEIEKQKFCDNKREEFLYYIEHGVLICEIANNRFQFLGCGQLQCKK